MGGASRIPHAENSINLLSLLHRRETRNKEGTASFLTGPTHQLSPVRVNSCSTTQSAHENNSFICCNCYPKVLLLMRKPLPAFLPGGYLFDACETQVSTCTRNMPKKVTKKKNMNTRKKICKSPDQYQGKRNDKVTNPPRGSQRTPTSQNKFEREK